MYASEFNAGLLALSKHKLTGVVALVVGVIILGLGALRVMKHMAGAALLALVGVAALIVGVLLYTRTI